jgi:ABC-type cobalamin transport system ATPase subunit
MTQLASSRRRFLIGAGTAAVAAPVPAALALQMPQQTTPADNSATAEERVAQAVDQIKQSMKAIHGGEWRACIDHETSFVLVIRDFNAEDDRAEVG